MTACIDPSYQTSLKKIWEGGAEYAGRLAWLKDQMSTSLPTRGSQILYNTQVLTNNLLDYARACRDVTMIDQLAGLYLTAVPYLSVVNQNTGLEHKEWKDSPTAASENALKSAQFVYLMARMMNTIGQFSPAERTHQMKNFVTQYHRVVLVDHLRRWVFARNADNAPIEGYKVFGAAWSRCSNQAKYSHYQWLQELRFKRVGSAPDYCNVVRDLDLWVIAATAEMVEARDLLNTLIPYNEMNLSARAAYVTYVNRGVALIQSRLTKTSLKNFQNQAVQGMLLDAGMWKNHPDYYFAGYSLPTKPSLTARKTVDGIGWDISHSRRFVQVFNTLHEKRALLGATFPTWDDMVLFANQFAYGAFNKDLNRPLFTNYMNGTVGWYRVNYLGNADLAYAPYGSSNAALNGGYGFWSLYNPDIMTIMKASHKVLATPSIFREKYYNHSPGTRTADPDYYYKWNRFDLNKASSLDYLQFYPTLVNSSQAMTQRDPG